MFQSHNGVNELLICKSADEQNSFTLLVSFSLLLYLVYIRISFSTQKRKLFHGFITYVFII